MKELTALLVVIVCGVGLRLQAQPAAVTPKAVAVAPAKKAKKKKPDKQDKSPANSLFGKSMTGLDSDEPMTTEIYADEAFFDSTKNMGIFSGRVKVIDPRFNLQSDKLTVFITKGENQGLEKAIAEGHVGVVRDRPDPNGGPPTRAVGRADKAIYTAATGDVELEGMPRVEEGANMHVATSPDTVMIINQNSQLRTRGPSRTEIRQQPKEEQPKDKKGETKKAETQAAPSQSVPASTLPTP
jgi:lipopolysaccharide transport protein LptA